MMNKQSELLQDPAGRGDLVPARRMNGRGQNLRAGRRAGPQPGRDTGQEWLYLLRAVQRHWRWSLAVAIAIPFGVAIIVLLLMTPVYEPTAKIEAAPPGSELFSLNPAVRWDSTAYEETQAKNLQTDQLAVVVIRKLHLDQNPEFVPQHSRVGRLLRRWFTDRFRRSEPTGGPLDLSREEREALKTFQRRLRVQRDTSSWLINVSFGSADPNLAALITNTIVEEFLEINVRTQHDAIVQGTQWLSHQLDDVRARMEESNRALVEFQKSTGIVGSGGGASSQSTFDQKMLELNHQLTAAYADRVQLEALLQAISPGDTRALPQVKADPVVQDIERKLGNAQIELRQALVIYGINHPKTKDLQAQIAGLQEQLTAQQDTIFANLKAAYAAAHTRESLLSSGLKVATKEVGKLAEYEALKREAQANEALYGTLYTKIKEAGIAAESKPSNIRWVDRARILDLPNRPQRLLDIVLGILAGIVAGISVAFLREILDNKVRAPEDVESLTALPSVSLMPKFGAAVGNLKPAHLALGGRNGTSSEIFMVHRPTSAESEALRGLLTSIRLSNPARAPQVLLVASALPWEGKTTIAANLSVALARQGFTTCLVDADIRRSRVAGIFGIHSQAGLSEVLEGAAGLDQALVKVKAMEHLTVLPGGSVRRSPGEVICSEDMRELLEQLRTRFQFIIVDSAPILPYADGRAIGAFADGVILVARSGVSTRQGIKRCLELLEQVQSAPVLELVLNGVDFNSADYRYGYGYA